MGDPDVNDLIAGLQVRTPAGCEWVKRVCQRWTVTRDKCPTMCGLVLQNYQPLTTNASVVVTSPDWFRVILVRNPLDRFLSGIIHKCFEEKPKALGLGPPKLENCPVPAWRREKEVLDRPQEWFASVDAVRHVMRRVIDQLRNVLLHRTNGRIRIPDHHFTPQALYCGTVKGVQWDHVAVYDVQNQDSVVRTLLRVAKLPEEAMEGWGSGLNETITGMRRYHTTLRDQSPDERLKSIYTPDIAADVVRLYAADYQKYPELRRTLPAWLPEMDIDHDPKSVTF